MSYMFVDSFRAGSGWYPDPARTVRNMWSCMLK